MADDPDRKRAQTPTTSAADLLQLAPLYPAEVVANPNAPTAALRAAWAAVGGTNTQQILAVAEAMGTNPVLELNLLTEPTLVLTTPVGTRLLPRGREVPIPLLAAVAERVPADREEDHLYVMSSVIDLTETALAPWPTLARAVRNHRNEIRSPTSLRSFYAGIHSILYRALHKQLAGKANKESIAEATFIVVLAHVQRFFAKKYKRYDIVSQGMTIPYRAEQVSPGILKLAQMHSIYSLPT